MTYRKHSSNRVKLNRVNRLNICCRFVYIRWLVIMIPFSWISSSYSQPHRHSAGEIAHQLKRLAKVGSVLYLAAHPDDENTRFIAWAAQGEGLDTAYLSLTRGGGGQNLIGDELSSLLGYVRTEELLSARAIDGGQQFFTRAIDFGYSKSAEEAEQTWGRAEVLRDVVRVIRQFRPDIIVCRFSPTQKSHGHHVASARLALEAVKRARELDYDPDSGQTPWSVTRVLENKPHWRMKPDTDTSSFIALEVGGYDPWRGLSFGEIAGASRSMHKSQGFGSSLRKTHHTEYFEVLAGKEAKEDIFEEITLHWSRFTKTQEISLLIDRLNTDYQPEQPQALIPVLVELDRALEELPESVEPYRSRKREQVKHLIAAVTGLWLDVNAKTFSVIPGGSLKVTLSALNRRETKMKLKEISIDHSLFSAQNVPLSNGELLSYDIELNIPTSESPTVPYWLVKPIEKSLYPDDPRYRGDPLEPAPLEAHIVLEVKGRSFVFDVPIMHRWVDPVEGERSRRVLIEPPVTITPKLDAQLLRRPESVEVEWVVEAGPKALKVVVLAPTTKHQTEEGYSVSPAEHVLTLEKEQEVTIRFNISCKGSCRPTVLTPKLKVDDVDLPSLAHYDIDYPHLPKRRVLIPSQMRVSPLDLKIQGQRVGYIIGAGDRVPQALRQMGYSVTELSGDTLDQAHFNDFDTIIFGIRAFNTNERIPSNHKRLMAWVERGGRVLVQYNTNNRWRQLKQAIGPFPLTIGRARVTDETAVMERIVSAKHPALNTPNRLTDHDYKGWVQERGLYFATDWDSRYTPLFSLADPGESPQKGSTLIAKHGEGTFIYTGLSFFRQLPAGVPGAYRLFANLLAL